MSLKDNVKRIFVTFALILLSGASVLLLFNTLIPDPYLGIIGRFVSGIVGMAVFAYLVDTLVKQIKQYGKLDESSNISVELDLQMKSVLIVSFVLGLIIFFFVVGQKASLENGFLSLAMIYSAIGTLVYIFTRTKKV